MKIKRFNESKSHIITKEDVLKYIEISDKFSNENSVADNYKILFPEKLPKYSDPYDWYVEKVYWEKENVIIVLVNVDNEKWQETMKVDLDEFIAYWNDPESFKEMKKYNL